MKINIKIEIEGISPEQLAKLAGPLKKIAALDATITTKDGDDPPPPDGPGGPG